MIEEPPCGYLLTEAQYTTPLADSPSLPEALRTSTQQRLEAHGIEVHPRATDYLVRMDQPLRGLIPLILDGQTEAVGAPIIVAGERVFDDAVCSSTFGLVRAQLDRLVGDGGIRENRERQVRHALDMAEPRVGDPQHHRAGMVQLERAASLLEQEADEIEQGEPHEGDPAGLRALAASIRALADTYRQ